MSLTQRAWSLTGSALSPRTLVLRRSNSGLTCAMYPSSVVQTGVKSLGCENRTAHESPIQSWKRIGPSVVSASKSGAVSPICRAISSSSGPKVVEGSVMPPGSVSQGPQALRGSRQALDRVQRPLHLVLVESDVLELAGEV